MSVTPFKVVKGGKEAAALRPTVVEFLEGLLADIKAGTLNPTRIAMVLIEEKDDAETGIQMEHYLPRTCNMSLPESIGYMTIAIQDLAEGGCV